MTGTAWAMPQIPEPAPDLPREVLVRAAATVLDHADDWDEARELLSMLISPCTRRTRQRHHIAGAGGNP